MAEEKKCNVKDENLKEFCRIGSEYDYKHQAMFFLNAMWAEYGKSDDEKEYIWKCIEMAGELDKKKFQEGNAMDEFEAAQFLEKNGQAMTVIERRKVLKEIDIDTDNKMSLLEYFVYHYKTNVNTLMERPQGVNEEVEKAEAALEAVLAEIAKIEKKKARLSKKAAKGGVKGKAAENELKIIEASDPLPVRQALVTAQAALRKAQKATDLNAMGKMWIIEREMEEAQKYKPKANWKRHDL